MNTTFLLLLALASATAFITPQIPARNGLGIRQFETIRFMAEQTTLEKEETAEEVADVAAKETEAVAEVEDESEMSESQKLLKKANKL